MTHMENTPDYFDIAMECNANFAWYLKGCLAYWAEEVGGIVPAEKIDPQQIAKDWLEIHHPERLLAELTEILEKA